MTLNLHLVLLGLLSISATVSTEQAVAAPSPGCSASCAQPEPSLPQLPAPQTRTIEARIITIEENA